VYFPIWKVDYVFNQKKYEVVVDGSSGEVFAASFPTRSSGAYMLVAIVGFGAIVGEGFLALESLLAGIGLIAVTVIGVFAAALFVARRL